MFKNPWLFAIVSWLWFFAAMDAATDAGWSMYQQLLLYPTGFLLVYVWCCYPIQNPAAFRSRLFVGHWFTVPFASLAVLLLTMTDLGLVLRLRLCEAEMQSFAESARVGQESVDAASRGKTVGLFHVEHTTACGSEMTLITVRGAFRSWGLSYWPDELPNGSGDEYQHLYGPWYRFTDDW